MLVPRFMAPATGVHLGVGDVEVKDAPAVMGQDDEAEEQGECGGGDDEEIAGCRSAKVIPKKSAPGL